MQSQCKWSITQKGKIARGREAKGGRGQAGERLNTLSSFLDAVLPAGPCSLTHWLEEGGFKKL